MSSKNILLINDTSNEQHIGSSTVIKILKNRFPITDTLRRKEINPKSAYCKKKIAKADLIIVNGEGSLHHSPEWFSNLLKMLSRFQTNVLINSLWQKMDIEYKLLEKFKLISVRESLSYDNLLSHWKDYSQRLRITPDVIFSYEPVYNFKTSYGDSVLANVSKQLSKNYNCFPLNFEKNIPSLEVFLQWLKQQEFHITGRFHGACLATLTETPFLTFKSNSYKIQGLLKDMDCEGLLINSLDEVPDKIASAKQHIPKMKKYVMEAKVKIEQLFKDMEGLL